MADLYAQRTLAVYRVWLTERGKPDEVLDAADAHGKDILDLFGDFCAEMKTAPAQVNESERFIRFRRCDFIGDIAFAEMESGRAGLSVSIMDTRTFEDAGSYREDMAGLVPSRMVLRRTPGFGYAVACIESVPNGGGVTTPLTMFRTFSNSKRFGTTMRYERIEELEALNAFTGIEEIELKRYRRPDDVSDSVVANLGAVSHMLRHAKRKLMPLSLVDGFLKDRRAVAEYVGVETEYSGREEIFVTLRSKEGRSRKFTMGKDLAVPVTELLNESGQQPLNDDEFIRRCTESCIRAESTLDRMMGA